MVAAAQVMGVRPLLHLANLTEADSFSGELAHALLSSPEARTRLEMCIRDRLDAMAFRPAEWRIARYLLSHCLLYTSRCV